MIEHTLPSQVALFVSKGIYNFVSFYIYLNPLYPTTLCRGYLLFIILSWFALCWPFYVHKAAPNSSPRGDNSISCLNISYLILFLVILSLNFWYDQSSMSLQVIGRNTYFRVWGLLFLILALGLATNVQCYVQCHVKRDG